MDAAQGLEKNCLDLVVGVVTQRHRAQPVHGTNARTAALATLAALIAAADAIACAVEFAIAIGGWRLESGEYFQALRPSPPPRPLLHAAVAIAAVAIAAVAIAAL